MAPPVALLLRPRSCHHLPSLFATLAQAHAWVCLGKLCLADEALAKKCVPLFAQVRAPLAPSTRDCARGHARPGLRMPARTCAWPGACAPGPWRCEAQSKGTMGAGLLPPSPSHTRASHAAVPCPCPCPACAQELGRAALPAVRNNIMVALADLVIHYTALVSVW